jgi:uncharacterized coiled-coil DUF342 family protein
MNDHEFQDKLGDLISQIEELPDHKREELLQLAEETRNRREKIKQTISGLQDSLDHLRLSVKYLVFDLEATRRENEYLRSLVDGGNAGPLGEGPDAD